MTAANASLQTDVQGATLTLHDYDMYLSESDHISAHATWCAVRAVGCLLDHASDDHWIRVGWAGYTRETVTAFLVNEALAEGRRRGFRHEAPRLAQLVPADAGSLLPPF